MLELPSNYDGDTAAFWDEQFALVNRNARVMDLCSGNGAVALLAQDFSTRNGLEFHVTAVDAATIDIASIAIIHPQFGKHLHAIEFKDKLLPEELDERPAPSNANPATITSPPAGLCRRHRSRGIFRPDQRVHPGRRQIGLVLASLHHDPRPEYLAAAARALHRPG
jgi:hypothetical protein